MKNFIHTISLIFICLYCYDICDKQEYNNEKSNDKIVTQIPNTISDKYQQNNVSSDSIQKQIINKITNDSIDNLKDSNIFKKKYAKYINIVKNSDNENKIIKALEKLKSYKYNIDHSLIISNKNYIAFSDKCKELIYDNIVKTEPQTCIDYINIINLDTIDFCNAENLKFLYYNFPPMFCYSSTFMLTHYPLDEIRLLNSKFAYNMKIYIMNTSNNSQTDTIFSFINSCLFELGDKLYSVASEKEIVIGAISSPELSTLLINKYQNSNTEHERRFIFKLILLLNYDLSDIDKAKVYSTLVKSYDTRPSYHKHILLLTFVPNQTKYLYAFFHKYSGLLFGRWSGWTYWRDHR